MLREPDYPQDHGVPSKPEEFEDDKRITRIKVPGQRNRVIVEIPTKDVIQALFYPPIDPWSRDVKAPPSSRPEDDFRITAYNRAVAYAARHNTTFEDAVKIVKTIAESQMKRG